MKPFIKEHIPHFITLLVGVGLWFAPTPEGITPQGWHMLAIFMATIVGIVTRPLPMGAVAMIALAVAAATQTLTIGQALEGYATANIWLIVIAFFIALGFIKTGLGTRISYYFVRAFGSKSLGLGYALVASETILAPAIPSITARTGGIIYPIIASLSQAMGSHPDHPSSKKLGTFLVLTVFQASVIASAMFLTAMAANPIAAQLASDLGYPIDWGTWALAAIVPGLVSLVVVPYLIYKISPPELKFLPDAKGLANAKLKEMGALRRNEVIMLGVFIGLVTFWIFGPSYKIDATTTAMFGVAVLMITRVVTWDELLAEKGAWGTLVWFGALVGMASFLNKFGVVAYFSTAMAGSVEGLTWEVAFLILALLYFYSHYAFASSMAHVGAMFTAFVSLAILLGTPPMVAVLVFSFFSSLYGGLTHYGIGSAPVLFGSRYVHAQEWWKVGFLISIPNILIWGIVGGVWWRFLGYW